jgi:hypothetical protein
MSAASASTRPANNLLAALRPSDFALIERGLKPWDGVANQLLYNPGDNVETIYFPCGPSLASFLVSSDDGRDVETTLIGREGAVGGIVSHGHLPAYTRIIVQVSGPFLLLKVADLEAAKRKSLTMRNFFARYADCLLAQIFQSTACNAIHTIEQRAAKWIVSTLERTGNHAVPLTQDQLAAMLGVGRSYTSRVMQTFKNEGFLEIRRGTVTVRDRQGLERRACRCNDSVKEHFEVVLAGVYPRRRAPEVRPATGR